MNKKQIIRFILGALGVIFLFWLFWQVRLVVGYFAISVVIALMGRPLMKLLEKVKIKNRRLPAWLNSMLVLISFLIIISLVIRFLTPVLSSQMQIIANLNIEDLTATFESPLAKIEAFLKDMNVQGVNRASIEQELAKYLDFSMVGNFFTSILSGLGSLLMGFMSVLFITFFLLKDQQIVNNIINSLTPDRYLEKVHSIITDTRELLSRYFLGVVLQISIIASIIGIGLSIIGIPNAILIGVLAGVFNIIPYLGPIIGTALGLTLSLLSNVDAQVDADMLPLVLEVLTVFAIAQLTDNFVLQPVIFSKSVKAHPLEIFVVIVVAGMLVGVVGMILAVPTYTFLRIVAREFFQGYKVVQGLTKDL